MLANIDTLMRKLPIGCDTYKIRRKSIPIHPPNNKNTFYFQCVSTIASVGANIATKSIRSINEGEIDYITRIYDLSVTRSNGMENMMASNGFRISGFVDLFVRSVFLVLIALPLIAVTAAVEEPPIFFL